MSVLKYLILLFSLLLLAGLYKPWWVLWWMARQNRKKVLRYYGIPLTILLLLYLVLSLV